jgi:type IV secretory pathway TrbF-like protein
MATANLSTQSTLASSPEVTSVELDGERVLLHISSGEYFGLNALGARIFELAEEQPTIGEIINAIHADHRENTSREQIASDVQAFITEMRDYDLLIVQDENSSAEAA